MYCDGLDYDSDDDGDNDYANYNARVGRRYAPRWSQVCQQNPNSSTTLTMGLARGECKRIPEYFFQQTNPEKIFWKNTGSDSDSQPTERHNNTIITPTILMSDNIVRLELRLKICFHCYNATLVTEPQMLNWIIFCS